MTRTIYTLAEGKR